MAISQTAVLDDLNVSAQSLLDLEGLSGEGQFAYLSGSLVEGFGNRRSDVDIFVVGYAEPAGRGAVIQKATCSIAIHFLGERRIDFEYWRPELVASMADDVRGIPVGQAFVADKLDGETKLFVHRLRIAMPLLNSGSLREVQSLFDWQKFQAYLVQEAVHRIDGALEDVWGMMEIGRVEEAALRARDLVGLGADVHRFANGQTNPLEKWRLASLRRLAATRDDPEILSRFLTLQFPQGWLDMNSVQQINAYIRSCVAYANETVREIQG